MNEHKIEARINTVLNSIELEKAHRNCTEKTTLINRMDKLNTPGLSFSIIDKYKIISSQGVGVKEIGKTDKVTKESMFLAGSVSKPVFALVVMKLKEKGIVDLDRDVNEYLKGWKVPSINGWQPKITLRQILSHTAGLTVHGFPGYLKSQEIPTITQILNGEDPANSPEVVVDILPGTTHRYSGGGYTIAQKVIEDILDKDFSQIMKEELFIPLNLQNSTYEQNLPEYRESQIVTAHTNNCNRVIGQHHIYPEMAAAGLWTTPFDLAVIILEIQKSLKGISNYLSKEAIHEMLSTQKIANNMGLGFFLHGKEENQMFYHGGSDEGFETLVIADKNHGQGAIVMINSNEGSSLTKELIKSIAKEFNWKNYPLLEPKCRNIKIDDLKRYIGNFVTETNIKIKTTIKNEKLYIKIDNQDPLKLFYIDENRFILKYLNTDIEFIYNDTILKSIVITQNGTDLIANYTR